MKIWGLKAPKTLMTFGWDDGGLPISGFHKTPSRITQVAQGHRWSESVVYDRDNTSNTIAFDVAGGFATHAECQWYVLTMDTQLIGRWVVLITVGEPGEPRKTCRLEGCTICAATAFNGVSWVANYTIVGGRIRETLSDNQ